MPSPAAQFRMQLGARIRALRLAKKWSQEALAERAGLSYKFLGEVERGTGNPSVETLFEIASALGIELGDFFAPAGASSAADAFAAGVSRDRLYSAREALESLDDLLKDLSEPMRRAGVRGKRRSHRKRR